MKPFSFMFSSTKLTYEGTLTHKFSTLVGLSAIGKSTMLETFNDRHDKMYMKVDFAAHATFEANLVSGLYATDFYTNRLLVVDEDCVRLLLTDLRRDAKDSHKLHLSKYLQSVQCHVLLVDREGYAGLPIDYKSVYTFELSNGGRHHKLVRVYKDYDTLDVDARSYLCEDKKSGFLYYSMRLNNVMYADGNSKIPHMCADKYVIADGAAFGPFIRKTLDMEAIDLYLPVSFEYDLMRNTLPANENTDPLDMWNPDEYLSMERMFTAIFAAKCHDKYHITYDKSHTARQVL